MKRKDPIKEVTVEPSKKPEKRTRGKGPEFLRFVRPLLTVLRESGGVASASEATEDVIGLCKVTDAELGQTNKNGGSRIKNQIAWARFYLVKAGLVENHGWGKWSLTERGSAVDLKALDVLEMFRSVQREFREDVAGGTEGDAAVARASAIQDDPESADPHRTRLLAILKSLPPKGFERICQRLLRESGFQNVTVTGKSGDGGIDGVGVLRVNDFVTFLVLFQCKRYSASVGSAAVREFRGSLQGKADMGIILTTGSFTRDAQAEARRDGVRPIELVDGEALLDLFEKFQLGLKQRVAYDVDGQFFEAFRSPEKNQ